nr:hypothetical protein [Tanacetum cinerariifolium]
MLPNSSNEELTAGIEDSSSRNRTPAEMKTWQQTEMASKMAAQDLKISNLKERIKLLKAKDKGSAEMSEDDAPIKGRTNILTSGVQAVSVPPVGEILIVGVPTGSGLVPTTIAIFTTASVVTPYSRRKGKEKMVESDTPKKKKLQEQIDVQMAREMEEEMVRDAQRMNEQIARDAEIAKIHEEEELQMQIDGLDRSNEVIARHLHEYEQSAAELTIGEKIELINELVKYQDHHSKILKYQAQQSKPLSKKQQREFYMSVLRSHSRWKTKHFKGERVKRKGLRLEQDIAKKMKTSEEVSEEDLKEMMQLVPMEEVYVEALQFDKEDLNQLWTLVKETLSIREASSDKEKELWVELKRLFKPDFEEQLKNKKGKFETVSESKPKTQGFKTARALPQKRKKAKIDKTTLEATKTPPTKDVPIEDSKKTHPTDSKDAEGNMQPTAIGLPSTSLNEGIRKLQLLLEGKTINHKDSEGNDQPTDKGLPSMVSDEALLLFVDELVEEGFNDDVFEANDEIDKDIHVTPPSAIAISSDSSGESVGSPPSQVILFGYIPTVIPSTFVVAPETSAIAPVISSAALVVETTIVASLTGLCSLVPYSDSDSDSPDEMAFPEYITSLPATSPFLFIDSSKDSDPSEASDSSEVPPSQDPYVTTVAHHLPSSSSSPTDSLPVHSSGLGAPDQAHSGSSTRVVSPRFGYPSIRAPRHSEAFRRWCAASLSTFYPPTTSESSLGDSSKRPLHSSSHSTGPSHKRCRSLTNSIPSSTPVIGSFASTRADLLPPHKRFRDVETIYNRIYYLEL